MSEYLKITLLLSKIGLILLLALAMIIGIDLINRSRCYNLPLNDFYNDKSCIKYVEDLDE